MVILTLVTNWRLVVNATPWPLYLRERDPVPIVQEAGWALEPFWASAEKRKIFYCPGGSNQNLPPRTQLTELTYELSRPALWYSGYDNTCISSWRIACDLKVGPTGVPKYG